MKGRMRRKMKARKIRARRTMISMEMQTTMMKIMMGKGKIR
jgi:hypothetical protein